MLEKMAQAARTPRETLPAQPRCRVSHCWHGAVEDGMCLGHLAEAYEHASHGCPDGVCEVCESTAEPIA